MGFQLKSDPNSCARLRIYDDEHINWRYWYHVSCPTTLSYTDML